jgi:hypothetical protein
MFSKNAHTNSELANAKRLTLSVFVEGFPFSVSASKRQASYK